MAVDKSVTTAIAPFPAPYWYNANVLLVHDGDTIAVRAKRGLYDFSDWYVRIDGINARELKGPGGIEARDYLAALIPVSTAVVLNTVHPDKYGRRGPVTEEGGRRVVLASITLADGSDLATGLIAAQWAAAWNGQGTKPVPPWPRTVSP